MRRSSAEPRPTPGEQEAVSGAQKHERDWKRRPAGYLVVLVLQEAGQGLHTGLQGRVLRLHLAAEPRHHGHGGVQRVLVHQVAAVPDEAQHAVQTAGLEYRARLTGTDQLQDLDHTGMTSQG